MEPSESYYVSKSQAVLVLVDKLKSNLGRDVDINGSDGGSLRRDKSMVKEVGQDSEPLPLGWCQEVTW